MHNTFDVVIAGAGPAGLMAARTAAESGLRIALLDRKTDIANVRRTDGGVIALNEYLYGQVVTFNRATSTLVFPVSGFSIKYDGAWNDNRYGFHIYSPGGKRFMIGDWAQLKKNPEKNSRGVALSKGRLLEGLLNEARKLGVAYFPDTNVMGVSTTSRNPVIETSRGAFEGCFAVAADGVNSRIVRSLGLNKKRAFRGTSRSVCLVMQGVRPPDSEGHIFIFTTYGTFSIMPTCDEDHFHLAAIGDDPHENLDALLDRLTRDDPVFAPWFAHARRVEGTESSVANSWESLEEVFYDNVILVGDACWSEQFSNPPALCAGYQLGHALTKAFIDEKLNREGVSQYLQWYDSQCFQPFGRQFSGGGVKLAEHLTPAELDYLAGLPAGPAPHTASFLKMFKTIFETYQGLVPQIRAERPEIMDKMKKLGEDMERLQAKRRKNGFPNR